MKFLRGLVEMALLVLMVFWFYLGFALMLMSQMFWGLMTWLFLFVFFNYIFLWLFPQEG